MIWVCFPFILIIILEGLTDMYAIYTTSGATAAVLKERNIYNLQGVAINIANYVGHGWVRGAVM